MDAGVRDLETAFEYCGYIWSMSEWDASPSQGYPLFKFCTLAGYIKNK